MRQQRMSLLILAKVLTITLVSTILFQTSPSLAHEGEHKKLRDTVSRSTMKKASKALKHEQRKTLEQAFESTHSSKRHKVSKKILKYRCGATGICECNFAFDCVDMARHANCKQETLACNFVSCTCEQLKESAKASPNNGKTSNAQLNNDEQVPAEDKEKRKKPTLRRQGNL